MDIIQFPMFEDNYGYLLVDRAARRVAAVDPGDAARVERAVEAVFGTLDEIWITHHHWDHAGANEWLVQRYDCKVLGPAAESDKVACLSQPLRPGDYFVFGGHSVEILDVGGHTLGHIAYWLADKKALFCGDTVFGLGCGRLFEGTADQMWESLKRVASLPDDTLLYSAHEYLMANASFALSVDPQNKALAARVAAAGALRAKSKPTVPMQLGAEKQTNPFFQPLRPEFLERYFPGETPEQVFAALRLRRNTWKA